MFERLATVQVSDDNRAFLSLVFVYRWAKCPFSRLLIYVNLFGLLAACDSSKFVSQKARPGWEIACRKPNVKFPDQCGLQTRAVTNCSIASLADINYVKIGICIKINEHEPSFTVCKSRNATSNYVVQWHKFIFLFHVQIHHHLPARQAVFSHENV